MHPPLILLFNFVLIAFFSAQTFAKSPANCLSPDNELQAQVEKVSCQLRDIAQHISEEKSIVPKAIYHFGKEEHMRENAQQGNIPQKAWDEFVMGEYTKWGLARNRRGFYGTAGIDTNSFGSSWLVEVQIADACRNPQNVVSFINMHKTSRFKNWFNEQNAKEQLFANIQAFKQACYQEDGNPHLSYKGNSNDPKCEKVFDSYLESTDVKIVQDHVVDKAFYIRDRSCIKKIVGTPEEIVSMAIHRQFLWLKPCSGFNQGLASFVHILMKALKEVPDIPKESIAQLKANFRLASPDSHGLDAYLRCRDKNQFSEFKSATESADFSKLCL